MRFLLPHPAMPSGGHIYNRKMLEAPSLGLLPLEAIPVDRERAVLDLAEPMPGAADDWILWDSLLMDRIPEAAALGWAKRHALLVHYLPSLDPPLIAPARQALRAKEDLAARSVEAFIATGRGLGRELRLRYPDRPVFVCEPGIEPAFPAARAQRIHRRSGEANLLTVANPLPAKGHLQLLALLEGLVDLEWCWHLVGDPGADPSFLPRWREAVARSGLGGRIRWAGPLSHGELAAFMGRMDIFLSASRFESYGMALAEAAAAGLPAVTTRVGEAERLVRDGVQGFVVDVGDWSRFQRLLRRMLEDPALTERMTRATPGEPVRTWQGAQEEFGAACRSILALPELNPADPGSRRSARRSGA